MSTRYQKSPLSQRLHWSIDLKDVPAILKLLDEHAMTVDIEVISHAGEVSIRAAAMCCREADSCLRLDTPEASVFIDLERLLSARAVCYVWGFIRRTSLELIGASGEYRFSVACPREGAAVWHRLLEALATVAEVSQTASGSRGASVQDGSGMQPCA